MARSYKRSIYKPTNESKYVGTLPIICRSSWERRLCVYLDRHPSILYWASETVVIPYYDPSSLKTRRYFVDFAVKYKTKTGELKAALIEVKPKKECMQPKKTNNNQRFLTEMCTYMTNQAKWAAATEYCKSRGMEFIILDEYSLGIK